MTRSRAIKRIIRDLGLEPGSFWSRVDIIGDIAVIKKPLGSKEGLGAFRALAERIISEMPRVNSVWLACSPVEGPYKTRRLLHLAGERRTFTIYKEHGCRFKVDISRVFVSPRLSHEHLRVARLVSEGERVVNMFAGAGIFSIIIAKIGGAGKVDSIDINPQAYQLMRENIKLNGLEGVVIPYLGDSREVVEERLIGVADRVLLPLPDLALEYSGQALLALRGRGWLHVYLHVADRGGVSYRGLAESLVSRKVAREGFRVLRVSSRRVRKVGPRRTQVVVDVEVSPCG